MEEISCAQIADENLQLKSALQQ